MSPLFWRAAASLFASMALLVILVPVLYLMLNTGPGTLWATLQETEVWQSLLITFGCAAGATAAGLVAGTPLAFLLARRHFPGREVIQGIIDLPVVIPHPVAGIALLLIFSGFDSRLNPVNNWWGIMLAMFFVSSSLLINTLTEGFAAVPRQMEWTARSLGLSQGAAFFRVSLPLVRRHLMAGAIMMWARSISEFGAIVLIVYHPRVASVLIYDRFTSFGLAGVLPVAGLLIWVSVLLFALLRWVGGRSIRLAAR